MCKGKKDRREDIPDSIDATLEQIDKDAYVNIYYTSNPDNHSYFISIWWKVHLNPPKSEDLFEK